MDMRLRRARGPLRARGRCFIALTQEAESGRSVPIAAESSARIRYRIVREGGGLTFERLVVQPDGSSVPLRTSLASALSRAKAGGQSSFVPTHEDLAIDRLVGTRQPGFFP